MTSKVEKKILNAALEVVAREKLSGTRMHMIAKEADMSQASLYYHFPTKENLLEAMLDNLQASFSDERKQYIDLEKKSVVENVKGFFDQKRDEILTKKKREYVQMDFWVQGTGNEGIRKKFKDNFDIWKSGIREVLGKNETTGEIDVNDTEEKKKEAAEMIPHIMVSLMLGASVQYLIDEESFDLDRYFAISGRIIKELSE